VAPPQCTAVLDFRLHPRNLAGLALPVNADFPTDIDIAFKKVDQHASPIGDKGSQARRPTGGSRGTRR
jgi:xanthine dehydrogenase YagR molybdenum-binding subunit